LATQIKSSSIPKLDIGWAALENDSSGIRRNVSRHHFGKMNDLIASFGSARSSNAASVPLFTLPGQAMQEI